MDALELKLCDIQGRLFELFADTKYDAKRHVIAFMNGKIAKNLEILTIIVCNGQAKNIF